MEMRRAQAYCSQHQMDVGTDRSDDADVGVAAGRMPGDCAARGARNFAACSAVFAIDSTRLRAD